MSTLRSKLIRLAKEHPEFRAKLLPVLKTAIDSGDPETANPFDPKTAEFIKDKIEHLMWINKQALHLVKELQESAPDLDAYDLKDIEELYTDGIDHIRKIRHAIQTGDRMASTHTAASTVLKSDIKLKDGSTLQAGTPITIEFDKHMPSLVSLIVAGRPKPIKINPANLHKYFNGFKMAPSRATMEKWLDSGIALSVTGQKVEPDGWGSDDAPSWLLALGIV